jgi:hypothetical protein
MRTGGGLLDCTGGGEFFVGGGGVGVGGGVGTTTMVGDRRVKMSTRTGRGSLYR